MTKPKFFLTIPALLALNGRISRLQYFVYGLIIAAILLLGFGTVVAMAGNGLSANPAVQTMIYVVVMSAFLWALVCLYAKRLHDLGWSAIWCVVALFDLPVDIVLNLVSLVTPVYETAWNFSNGLSTIGNVTAMIMGLILTFRRGQRGPNRYGPDPLQPPQTDTSVF